MAYVEVEDLKAYTGIPSATVTDDALLRDLIQEATRLIDMETGRVFESVTDTRYYGPEALDKATNTLWVDQDLLTVTELLNGDDDTTEIESTEFWLIDRNAGPPYYGIRLLSDSDDSWEWDTDGWVSVTGTWGWSATPPADIVLACKRLAAYLYQQKDSAVYEVTVYPEQGVQVTPMGIPVDVERMLKRYKRLVHV
jgi:hypothetical protein